MLGASRCRIKLPEKLMSQEMIYRSGCTAKSLWQEYRIYDDRVELHTWLGPVTVPFDQVEGIEIARSYSEGVRLQLRGMRSGIKLDWADFCEHVVLDKSTGLFRHVAFTPDNPEEFVAALEGALERFQQRSGGAAT
jgi:hypothetical protein